MSIEKLQIARQDVTARKQTLSEQLKVENENLLKLKQEQRLDQVSSIQIDIEIFKIEKKITKYEDLIKQCNTILDKIRIVIRKPEKRHREIDPLLDALKNAEVELKPSNFNQESVNKLEPIEQGPKTWWQVPMYIYGKFLESSEPTRGLRGTNPQTDTSGLAVTGSYKVLTPNTNSNLIPNKPITNTYETTTKKSTNLKKKKKTKISAGIKIDPSVKGALETLVKRIEKIGIQNDEDLNLDVNNPDPVKIKRVMEAAECLIQLAPIVDASRSQTDAFNGVKNFIKQLLDKANVAPGLSALVINAFNTKGYTSATSADKFSLQQNKAFLDTLKSEGGTVLSHALKLVKGQIDSGVFTPEIGKKIMIPLVSDGVIEPGDLATVRAYIASIYAAVNQKTGGKTVEDAKKYVQFVGIWIEGLDGLNEDLLKEICPEPEYRFVFTKPNFPGDRSSLEKATNSILNIMKALCGAPIASASPTAAATTQPTIAATPQPTAAATTTQPTTAATPQPTTAATRQMTTAATTPQPTADETTAKPTAAPTFAPEIWWALFLPFIFPREAAENAQLLEDDIDQQGSVESQEALNVLNEITVDAPEDIKDALNVLGEATVDKNKDIKSKINNLLLIRVENPNAWKKYWAGREKELEKRSDKWKPETDKNRKKTWIYDGWRQIENGKWQKDGTGMIMENVDYQKLILEDLGRMGIYVTNFKGKIPPDDEDMRPEPPPPAPTRHQEPPKPGPGPSKKEYYIPKQFRITWAPIPWQTESLSAVVWTSALGIPFNAIPYATQRALALSKISTWLKDHPEKYSLAMSRLYPTLLNKVVPEKAADMVGRLLECIAPGRVVSEDEFKKIIAEARKNSVNIDIDQINAGKRKPGKPKS